MKRIVRISITLILLAVLTGCGFISVNVKEDFKLRTPIRYVEDEAFEKGVKACSEIGLTMGLLNKDGGQIQCLTDYSAVGSNYELDIFFDKEKGLLKRINIKVMGLSSTLPPSEAKARELISQYLNALKRMGIE